MKRLFYIYSLIRRFVWKEKVEIVQERRFHKPIVRSGHFPDGTWVKAKRSGGIRYITRQTSSKCFEDDGKRSKQPPSPHCHYDNYEVL